MDLHPIVSIMLGTVLVFIIMALTHFYGKKAEYALIKAWQQFARLNNLNFEYGDFTDTKIHGNYLDYSLSIHNEYKDEQYITIFSISRRDEIVDSFKNNKNNSDVMRRFWAIYDRIKSGNRLNIKSERIFFRSELIRSTDEFLPIIKQLIRLIEIYHEVCKIGGEVVDSLLQAEPFKTVIWQIIKDISDKTTQRIKPITSLLLCKKCLTFCSSHKVKPPFSFSSDLSLLLTGTEYYGCRLCRQSRDFYEGRTIAILDNLITEKQIAPPNNILVNWLIYPKPFDFHEVRIIHASDREVEEFVMQVGNDMDKFRQPRYKEMLCIISSNCKLSANTLNLLKHTFKSVKEM